MIRKTLVIGMLLLLAVGCRTPSNPRFVDKPQEMIGYGIDNSWMWVDANKLGDELVKNKLMATHIEMFGCSPSRDAAPVSGYWMYRFPDVQPYLKTFISAMKKRKVVTVVTICGWNSPVICDAALNAAWFTSIVNFMQNDIGTEGVVLQAASEPLDARGRQCDYKFTQFTQILDATWKGLKSWNAGSRPHTAPAGYWIEYHPLKSNDIGVPFGVTLTDSPITYEFSFNPADPNSFIDPNKIKPYVANVYKNSRGFIYYGFTRLGWQIDKNGIKAIGDAAK